MVAGQCSVISPSTLAYVDSKADNATMSQHLASAMMAIDGKQEINTLLIPYSRDMSDIPWAVDG